MYYGALQAKHQPGIYSGRASAWLLDAAVHVLDEYDPDVLFVSTTDVIPHRHGPHESTAEQWVNEFDAGVAALHERSPRVHRRPRYEPEIDMY